jgi:hypothetical protein
MQATIPRCGAQCVRSKNLPCSAAVQLRFAAEGLCPQLKPDRLDGLDQVKVSVFLGCALVVGGAITGFRSGGVSTGLVVGAVLAMLCGGTIWSMRGTLGNAHPPFSRGTFEEMSRMLSAEGFSVVRAEYQRRSFGSWIIDIAATPPVRVVWDGKESCLCVEKGTEQTHPDFGWKIYEPIVEMRHPVDEGAALRAAIEAVHRSV